ncbi:MAG: chaperone modulatory protein CbpM [Gammaproteobacteria bacterium]|nr:chaperone modulatory protein CbpM [Gammaproteobacteria bacterium]MAY03612.1 chaperone modulatory protein CbpM [Gammaproteobacteria bacterium]|tara:strand:- start:62 stop:403 length:342 start_codon:yes stop_codon:yes gene_type:complete
MNMSKSHDPETIMNEHFYSFSEVCERQSLKEDFIIHCVEFGIIEVRGGGRKQDWMFSFSEIPRLEKAYRLHADLGIDYSGLALVLELLDEINDLRVINDILNKRLERWEEEKE